MAFVNREVELRALESWWAKREAALGLVWGRRRVGKTVLLQHFAQGKRAIFHTASTRPVANELAALSKTAAATLSGPRDFASRPFTDWGDVLDSLAVEAKSKPLLLILDEFPELVTVSPELDSVIRASWDRIRTQSQLRILLCGSAVRTMEALQQQRAPLYGRMDLSLLVHPFRPHEASIMLPKLRPADRALVWGICGGVPLYLEWWDQNQSVRGNVRDLICTAGGLLLSEGELVLATEVETGALARQVIHAIAAGRTKHNEIETAVKSEVARTLDRLVELRLVERVHPVTETGRTRRQTYRIADNFLAFWLSVVNRYRGEILRGLGNSILPVIMSELDDHMGPRWEEAFRLHLRRMADEGKIAPDIVSVGRFWTAARIPVEIDAVVLAGRSREAVLVGEAKWARRVDGDRIVRSLSQKVGALPRVSENLRYAVCGREEVTGSVKKVRVTAEDIFG